jgi:hypothetical protein
MGQETREVVLLSLVPRLLSKKFGEWYTQTL